MEKMNVFMSSIEKYIGLNDNILKSYSMIGVIMIHCSQILYVKGKTNCLFNVLMYTHILSNSFLTGTSPTKDVVQAVHKIWHSLIVGIEKLDYRTDANISSMLTHLVVKWLPYFAKMVSTFGGHAFHLKRLTTTHKNTFPVDQQRTIECKALHFVFKRLQRINFTNRLRQNSNEFSYTEKATTP